VNDESEEPAQSEVTAQLEAAQNEIVKLKKLLDGGIVELRMLQRKGLALRCSEALKRISILCWITYF